MKYISKITLAFGLFVSLLSSCKDDNGLDTNSGISLDKEEISVGPDGGVESLIVSSGMEWVSSSSQPWIAVSPANGYGSVEGTLAIDSTLEVSARKAQVRYRQSDNQEKILNVTQFGYGKQIIPAENNLEVKSSEVYDNRYFDLTVSTNVAFKVDSEIGYEWGSEIATEDLPNITDKDKINWIVAPENIKVDLDRKDRPRTVKIRFRWEMNTVPYKRVATIKLIPQDPDVELIDQDGNPTGEVVVTVIQEPAVRITDDRQGDSLAIIAIHQKIQSLVSFNMSEKMDNWDFVTLWEEGDNDMPDGAQGRVRSLSFMLYDMKEGEILPREIKYLKYLETFTMNSNANRHLKNMKLCDEIAELKYLKKLSLSAYGMTELPKSFMNLGTTLEYLDLSSNNFSKLEDITDIVNSANFPKLKGLEISGCRKNDTTVELDGVKSDVTSGKLGLYLNLNDQSDKSKFIELLKWEKLEHLGLSYMFIEGTLPTDDEMLKKFDHYKQEDFYEGTGEGAYNYDKLSKDTCGWLLDCPESKEIEFLGKDGYSKKVKGSQIPRVLPKTRSLSINLNYITGELPCWIIFHPYFYNWGPEGMIINQWEKGKDTNGKSVGFSNISHTPDYKYYWGDGTEEGRKTSAYPKYYNKYVGGGSEEGWNPTPSLK